MLVCLCVVMEPSHWLRWFHPVLTSTGVGEFGPAEEAQVSRSSPDGLRVSEAESGVEMVRLQRLVAVNREVPAGVVAAVHPDLQTPNRQLYWVRTGVLWENGLF